MYPVENVITFSDNLLGTVPIFSIFRILGFDIFTAFQLWFIAIFALNFVAAYWLFNWLFKNRYSASVAAFIFAFSISLQSQMAHAQVFARFFIPLAFLFIFKFGKEFNPKYFFLAGLCVVGQFYCGIQMGMITALPFSAVTIILIALHQKMIIKKIKSLKWWMFILASIAINVLFLYILISPYYDRSLVIQPYDYDYIISSLPTFISYIFAKHGSLVWGSLDSIGTDLPAWWDHQLFPGIFVFIALIGSTIIYLKYELKNRLEIRLLFLIGMLTLFFFIRIGEFTLYQFIYQIPGFIALRTLTRIMGFDLIVFALATGILLRYLVDKFAKKQALVFSLVLAFALLDNFVMSVDLYRSPKAIALERLDHLVDKMNHLPIGTVVSYEPEHIGHGSAVQIDAMLATQALGLKSINGYSATSPSAFTPYWLEPNAETRKIWLESVGLDPELPMVIK